MWELDNVHLPRVAFGRRERRADDHLITNRVTRRPFWGDLTLTRGMPPTPAAFLPFARRVATLRQPHPAV
jgi:hypothetical protein